MSAKRRPTPSPFRPIPAPAALQVVDQEEAEKAHYIICLRVADGDPTTPFLPANRLGRCVKCNERVFFSATAPKKPPRLCLVCYTTGLLDPENADDEEEHRMIVTQTILDEVRDITLRQSLPQIPETRKPTIN